MKSFVMSKKNFTLFILSVLVFASCGQEHNAKSCVRAFMKEEMTIGDFDALRWSKVDSTFRVTDSTLTVMREAAAASGLVKGNAAYAKRTNKLNRITLTYVSGEDTLVNTFYLDDELQGVVGVKKDVFMAR